ncbi:hypothetical protein KEM56_007460 [Ascosphaera pollenicola]|nr:hypothetical protein KEM56_007460 [Ascosphaera pollenicola]
MEKGKSLTMWKDRRSLRRPREKKSCCRENTKKAVASTHHVVRGTYVDVQDLQTYLSLSPKIQKQLFSPEERAFFAWWSSNIFEAAETSESCQEPHSPLTSEFNRMDKDCFIPPRMIEHADSAIEIDDCLIHCLDTHDIDLTLNNYTDHVSDAYSWKASPDSRKKHTRGASLCRNWAISPKTTPEQDEGEESEDNIMPSPSKIRPRSPSTPDLHRSWISQSVPDGVKKAHHYQDPEARWKLRVFLSDPENFDEAVQHGFPAGGVMSDNPETSYLPPTPPHEPAYVLPPPIIHRHHARSRTLSKSRDSLASSLDRMDHSPRPGSSASKPLSERLKGKRSAVPLTHESRPSEVSEGREMTIKMTLTPSDLREENEQSFSSTDVERPTFVSDLSIMDEGHSIWNDMPVADNGMLRRIWRKLKKTKDVKS